MKIVFSCHNDKSSKSQKQNIVFGAGLTPKIIQEIKNADVLAISKSLAKKGVDTNFRGNKIIAWGSQKTVHIVEQFNNKFGANLTLPKGIYVEDFGGLKVDNQSAYGFCNMAPICLKKDSKEIIPEKTIFFNTFRTFVNQIPEKDKWLYDWRYLNKHADKNYVERFSCTDNFLDPFFHEFGHIFHEGNMINEIGIKSTIKKLAETKKQSNTIIYNNKYGDRVSQICNYAKDNPLDAVACDISKYIANSLDKETLNPIKNPFIGTPYENLSFKERINVPYYSDKERPLKEILRNFWNGKFD